jgi:fumarate hydratase subunit alpha
MDTEKKTRSTLRRINTKRVTKAVKNLFIEANTVLGEDVVEALRQALSREQSETGKQVLEKIIENAEIARRKKMPICQDTGLAVVFVEMGQDVHIVGGELHAAIEEGVRQAYSEGYLRKSVCDPFTRDNTTDNLPAIIHIDIVAGSHLKIIASIKKFVMDTVEAAGANPCPPIIIGVGIGGSLEQACVMAKKALLRPIGEASRDDERLEQIEKELYQSINNLGVGPAGLGGRVTALAVHIEMMPCHIASLPVAVNIQCHVARHKETTL